jgi:phage terminase large subunit-like protein
MVILAVAAFAAMAQNVGFGQLYYEGQVVRTVVPPAKMTKEGRDNLFVVMGGTMDQLPVIAVAPGARGYHGGQWAFHSVTWNTTPYLLTSASAVLAAESAGDVTITRVAANDFKCPVQP